MKASIVLLFYCACAYTSLAFREQAFRSRREYVYKYETQILTRLEQSSHIISGFRMNALARVQFLTWTKINVQLENVALYRINQPAMTEQVASELLDETSLLEMVGPEADSMMKLLQLPFSFQYAKGRVIRVLLSGEEMTWSADVKRGLASVFEINLEKRLLITDGHPRFPPYPGQDKEIDIYKVMEPSATGTCETLYTVIPKLTGKHLLVQKTKNFDRCLDRPRLYSTIFDGYWTPEHKKDNPLSTGSSMEYSLSGTKDRFLILAAIIETKMTFSPAERESNIQTSVNQTMYLLDAKTITPANIISFVKHRSKTVSGLPMKVSTAFQEFQDPFQLGKANNKRQQEKHDAYPIESIYTELIQAAAISTNVQSPESLVHMRLLTDMLRSSPEDSIQKLWEKATKDSDPRILKVLWNVVPHVGTEAAANLVLDVCTNDVKFSLGCVTPLNALTLKAVPTSGILYKLDKMLQEKTGSMSPKLEQVSLLTLGSFTFKLALAKYYKLQEIETSLQILQSMGRSDNHYTRRYVSKRKRELKAERKKLLNLHAQTEQVLSEHLQKNVMNPTPAQRINGLKALGNAGIKGYLPTLKKIAEDHDEPLFTRIMAIIAHRRMYLNEDARHQARLTLQRLYENRKEVHEIRNMAFTILMALWPDDSVFQDIARGLHDEKDVHVSQYVLSYLTHTANSSYTAFWRTSKAAKDALEFAPPFKSFDIHHSYSRSKGHMLSYLKMGSNVHVSSVGDSLRYEGCALGFDAYLYGMHTSLFEIGYNGEGISSYVGKLFGPSGIFTNNKSLFDVLKRPKRETANSESIIDKIFETLNVKNRTDMGPTSHIYYKVMGHELGYHDFSSTLRSIASTGKAPINFDPIKLSAGMALDFEDTMLLHDTQLTLPTEAGLPISLKLQAATTIKINGKLSLQVAPQLFESERNGQKTNALSLSFNAHPRLATEIHGSMGLDSYFLKTSTAFRSTLRSEFPIQADFKVNIRNATTVLTSRIPRNINPITEFIMEPMSETQLLNIETPKLQIDRVSIPPPMGATVQPINTNSTIQCLGLDFIVQGQRTTFNYKQSKMCMDPLSGRTDVNILLKPTDDTDRVIEIITQPVYYTHGMKDMDPQQNHQNYGLRKNNDAARYSSEDRVRDDLSKSSSASSHVTSMGGVEVWMEAKAEGQPRSSTKSRRSELRLMCGSKDKGHQLFAYLHLRRSAIEGYDDKEWQFHSDFSITYPKKRHSPKDVLSNQWQMNNLQELHDLINMSNHKIQNEVLNRTLFTLMEQTNQNTLSRIPAYSIINAVIPQVLDTITPTNDSSTQPQIDWKKYWNSFGVLNLKVVEEEKLILDSTFINRDAILISYLIDLLDAQRLLVTDLEMIARKESTEDGDSSGTAKHRKILQLAEFPVMQYVVLLQERCVYQLEEIITRAEAMGTISKVRYMIQQLQQSKGFLDIIIKTVHKIISTELDDNRGYYTRHSQNLQINNERRYTDEQNENADKFEEDYKELRNTLYFLSVLQMQVIKEVQLSLSRGKHVAIDLIFTLARATRNALEMFDSNWEDQPLDEDDIKEVMLLITTQNVMLVDLLHQYRFRSSLIPTYKDTKAAPNENIPQVLESHLLKGESYYLSQRTASIFKYKMEREVVNPALSSIDRQYLATVQKIHRGISTEMRRFELEMVYNTSTGRDQTYQDAVLKHLTKRIDSFIHEMSALEKNLTHPSTTSSNMQVILEIVETSKYMKSVVETALTVIQSIHLTLRDAWTGILTSQLRKIDFLPSLMSSSFGNISNKKQTTQDQSPKKPKSKFEEFLEIMQRTEKNEAEFREMLKGAKKTEANDAMIESIDAKLFTYWGHDGNTSSIGIEMRARRSAEHLLWLLNQVDPASRSIAITNAINEDLMKEPSKTNQMFEKLNTYDHLHFTTDVNKEDPTHEGQQYLDYFQDFMKVSFWNKYLTHQAPLHIDNKQHFMVDVSEMNKKVDMFFTNKERSLSFQDVPLPTWVDKFLIFTKNTETENDFSNRLLTKAFGTAQCTLRKNRVETIDGVSFSIQPEITKCSTLLAMDCSPERAFAITMVNANSKKQNRIIRILGEGKVIDIELDSATPSVRLDDTDLDLRDDQPFVLERTLFYELSAKYLTIKISGSKVDIALPLVGVQVVIHESDLNIRMSELFKHKTCGLCGNFDAQQSWEFEGPKREVYTSPISFASAYVLPSPGQPECRVDPKQTAKTLELAIDASIEFVPGFPYNFNSVARDQKNTDEADDSDDDTQEGNEPVFPEAETDIRIRFKRRQVCFSMTPVFRCPVHANPTQKAISKVEYVCLSASDPRIEKLRESVSLGPLSKTSLKLLNGVTFARRIRQETVCASNDDRSV